MNLSIISDPNLNELKPKLKENNILAYKTQHCAWMQDIKQACQATASPFDLLCFRGLILTQSTECSNLDHMHILGPVSETRKGFGSRDAISSTPLEPWWKGLH